ncbi:MAG: peptide deformylase [Clostridiales bacterium]|jgi:peptide deformylase|nr:peptide deformylase [Clostridiales bacterium]
MALRTIRQSGDPLLRKISKPVRKFDSKMNDLLDDMIETLKSVNGLGLAAPQVGALKRAIVVNINDVLYEIINPEILESRGSQNSKEGCLSVAGKNGYVRRPEYLKIKARDRNGDEYVIEGEGLLATALSHEIDHLDGILYIDKAIEVWDATDEDGWEDENGEEGSQ